MANWVKRFLTVAVLAPLAVTLLSTRGGSQFLVVLVTALPLWEFNSHVAPAIVARLERKGAAPFNVKPEFGFATLVGIGVAAAACTFALLNGIVAITFLHVIRYQITGSEFACPAVVSTLHAVAWNASMLTVLVALVPFVSARAASPSPASAAALVLQIFGIVYIAWTMSTGIMLRTLPYGQGLQVLVCIVIWNVDNGALVVGSALGGSKFIPAVSPGKTWAGVWGGLFGGCVTAAAAWWMGQAQWPRDATGERGLFPPFSAVEYVVGGFGLGCLGILGDLVESVLKRAAAVKDSGRMLPGVGGMLDRMDSLLVPVAGMYYCLSWLAESGAHPAFQHAA